jgi:hydrogenase maturation protease
MDPVRQIADAVLYEGYLLWPYRRSAMKNQRRWTFGGVYPRDHSERHPDDRWLMRTECLLLGDPTFDVTVRFLHVAVRADGWEEAIERELGPGPLAIPAGRETAEDAVCAWHALEGAVDVRSEPVSEGLTRIVVEVTNTTPFEGDRREALRRTFCSTHTVLRASHGTFVSLAGPPDALREHAAACRNEGTWPVLVGDDDRILLSSPIILEDHPRIAPESPGDLFDGGEIDELLILNVLALTDEEKAEMRETDPRAREILERSESLSGEQLLRLHGEVRRP